MGKRLGSVMFAVVAVSFYLGTAMASDPSTTAGPQAAPASVQGEAPQHNTIAPSSQEKSEPQKITSKVAGDYALFAMMAANAYHSDERIKYPLDKIGWIQIDKNGKATTEPTRDYWFGLEYDIYEKQATNEVVFAIRGTDSPSDHFLANFTIPVSPHYKKLNKDLGNYIEKHPNKQVTATGHSLGGGLALSASVHYGIVAITFDPSPRVFDGLGDHHKQAKRIVIYEQGDPLQTARKNWKKISEVVTKENFFECSVVPANISQHRGDCLALGLLDLGKEENKELLPIWAALPPTERMKCSPDIHHNDGAK